MTAAGIRTIPPSAATGRLRALYAEIGHALWIVPHALQVFSLRPDLLAACYGSFLATMTTGTLSRRTKEALAVVVSKANACAYNVDAHTVMLMATGLSPGEVERLVRQPSGPGVNPVSAAAMAFAGIATTHLEDVTPAILAPLRTVLADDGAVVEVVQVVAGANFMNRIVNALGVRPELPPVIQARPVLKRMAHAVGAAAIRRRLASASGGAPRLSSPRKPAVVLKEIEAVCREQIGLEAIPFYCACRALAHRPAMLEGDWAMSRAVYTENRLPLGTVIRLVWLTASLNHASDVEADAAAWLDRHGLRPQAEDEQAARLDAFVRQVVRTSHRVTSRDLDALRAIGWTDEAILEAAYIAAACTAQNLMAKALTDALPSDRRPDIGASRPSRRP